MKTRIRQLTEQEKRSLREQQMITNWIKSSSKGVLSIFSDPSDLWKLIIEYLPNNKEAIMARDGKLVITTNSSDPVDIICGKNSGIKGFLNCTHKEAEQLGFENIGSSEAEFKGVIELLWDIFGGIVNEQGYKVLDSHIGAIYSDSITPEHQVKIYERLAAKGFAATNIVLGIDSYSMEYTTKNLSSIFAKSTWFEIKNLVEEATDNDLFDEATDQYERKSYNIYKDPVIDDKNKNSLAGLLQVYYSVSFMEPIGCLKVKTDCTFEEENKGFLQVIYENGVFKNQTSLQTIRKKLLKN